jgi:hypothetical protein
MGGVLAGLFSQRRGRSLDPLAWPDRPDARRDGAQGAGQAVTQADAGIDDPDLGLSRDIDDLVRGQLDTALGISTAGVR